MERLMNLHPRVTDSLNIWTVYQGLTTKLGDGRRRYGAKRFIVTPEGQSLSDELLISDRLEELRVELARRGLVRLERLPEDDARIVEVWL